MGQTIAAWAFIVFLVLAGAGWWKQDSEKRAARQYLARKGREERRLP